MDSRSIILDKAVKISIIIGTLVVALSIAYYLVIFLPKNKEQKLEPSSDLTLNKAEIIPPANIIAAPQEAQTLDQKEISNSNNINAVTAPVIKEKTAEKTISNKKKSKKKNSSEPAPEAAAAKTEASEVVSDKTDSDKGAGDSAAAEIKAAVKTKITIYKVTCLHPDIPETIEAVRQPALDYIDRLKKDGENIIEVREEKCRRFVIIMEDK